MRLHTHASIAQGESYVPDDLIGEFLPPGLLDQSILGTDMDGTMYASPRGKKDGLSFKGDLGKLVFLEKLGDPKFWRFKVNTFWNLVLPVAYREQLTNGKSGKINGLKREDCNLALRLWRDIGRLYILQKKLLENKKDDEIDVNTPVVNEFAHKMIVFDRIMMKMDAELVRIFAGQLLMRTRFFAGKTRADVATLVSRVMERTEHAPDRHIRLATHRENCGQLAMEVTRRELPAEEHDRLVITVESTRILLRRFVSEKKVPGIVITANLEEIALQAIRNSEDYKFLLAPDNHIEGHIPVVASTLSSGRNRRYNATMDGLPVFGEMKAKIAQMAADFQENRKFRIALGDSPGTDGQMGQVALLNEGVFIVVSHDDDLAQTHASFEPVVAEVRKLANGHSDVDQRVWYISSSD